MTMAMAQTCAVDFYAPETIADPLPCYRAMLAAGPVAWMERNSIHAIVHFAELVAVLRDHRGFSSGRGVALDEEANARLVGSTLNSDPPVHDETRAITAAPLTPKALEAVRSRIETAAEELAETMVARGSFDAAAELAPHLPLNIVRDLVGLSQRGRGRMLDWAAATFELMGDCRERRPAAFDDLVQLRAYLDTHATRDQLAPGGWAARIFEIGDVKGLMPDHCAQLMRDYIAPSLDTTISAIGYAVALFARHPREWHRLREEPSLTGNAIEEVVRLNSPIRAFTRFVTQDTEVAGVPLSAGARVLVCYGAANRDPRRFEDPDRFDITRNVRGHVGFGHGVHTCMGMHLARLEMTCLFNALIRRVERFELTGEPRTVVNSTIHAYASVPVRAHRLR
jgi:cytochrome P450